MKDYDTMTGELLPAEDARGLDFARSHEAAAMDIQVATAQRLGRDIGQFQADLESWACASREIAEECTYVLTKGGSRIVGPSIRFAELIMSSFRHLIADVFIEEEQHGHVVCGAMCRDLFRNTAVRTRVRRSLLKRDGSRVKADQVTTTIQAAQSLALRNAIMKLCPKALWQPIWLKSREVAFEGGVPFQERVEAAFKSFAGLGIQQETILTSLGKESRGNLDGDDLISMRNTMRSLRAGELDPENAFPAPRESESEAEERARQTEEKLAGAAKKKAKPKAKAVNKHKAKPKPEPEAPVDDIPFGEDDGVEVEL